MIKLLLCVLICTCLWSTTNAGWEPESYKNVLSGVPTWRLNREARGSTRSATKRQRAVFPCETPQRGSTEAPTSVHKLKPSDVNVIAALGDSITAGNGIRSTNAVDVLRQLRGQSWSMGGDLSIEDGVNTLANVLKKYNPELKGFSTGYGGPNTDNAWMNVAIAGATAKSLPAEADHLIANLQTDSRIDWANDWKVITLLIGGNNMCDYCNDRVEHSPEAVGDYIRTALDKLHAQIPRALVNLVPMADITPVPKIKTGIVCSTVHWSLCTCAVDSETSGELKGVQLGYYEQMKALASSGRYDTRDDFTVVLQPFMVNQDFPHDPATGKYDKTYIAPDCFHPNYKSHAGMAKLLWNSMITPVSDKIMSLPNDELITLDYKCPTTDAPYFFTSQNSE